MADPIVITRNGTTTPAIGDLTNFQLGYDSAANILYIRDGGAIIALNGRFSHVVTVTDTYAVLVTDDTVVCNKATAFTVTLPAAVVRQRFHIKNINTGTVTLEGDSAETIDGAANQAVVQWESITVQCYEAGKWVIL